MIKYLDALKAYNLISFKFNQEYYVIGMSDKGRMATTYYARIIIENKYELNINGLQELAVEFKEKGHYADDIEWDNFNILSIYMIELCNKLGVSIKKFSKYKSFVDMFLTDEEGSEEVYQEEVEYYRLEEFWEYLSELDNYQFFLRLILIAEQFDDVDVINSLVSYAKSAMKILDIRVPRYKKTVFVAMSFNESLKEIRDAICRVISVEGFKPILIDAKEHNKHIVPEIFDEIDQAEFVIADLTQQRAGVYFEAGYAKGKGKEVIITCSKEELKNRHFDVEQLNTIFWENNYDLMSRLSKRIEAMSLSTLV